VKIFKFFPLLFTNFWGVLNDNFLKELVCFISITWYAKENESLIIAIAGGMLVIPYLLFSPLAGKLARTQSKITIVKYAKLAEIPIMVLGISGFYFENIYLTMSGVLCMGVQSALFSPAKYGLIRDIGGLDGVSLGTGALEMFTFLAVLIGTFLAGIMADMFIDDKMNAVFILGGIAVGVAAIGWGNSYLIKADESDPEEVEESINVIAFLKRSITESKKIEGLLLIVSGLSMFWLISAVIKMNLIGHCKYIYNMSSTQTGLLMSTVAISIGVGCAVAGVLSKQKASISLSLIGMLGMGAGAILLGLWTPSKTIFYIVLNAVAFMGGLFKVPLNAWIQINVKGRMLGEMIAFNNFAVFCFILLASAVFALIEPMFGSFAVFLVVGLFSVATFILFYRYRMRLMKDR